MQISIALLTLAASAAQSLAEAFLENGYYYRNEVKGIQYTNVGFSGQYQEVTFMDKNNGQCPRKSVQFSGSLAPLHEEVYLRQLVIVTMAVLLTLIITLSLLLSLDLSIIVPVMSQPSFTGFLHIVGIFYFIL